MTSHVGSFVAFSPNDQCYGDNRDIVCSNDLILHTNMHLAMDNNVSEESFHFLCTKKPYIFPSVKKGFFCEASTKNMLQNGRY